MNEARKVLFDDGTISALYRAGFISKKPFLYRDIFLWVDAQLKIRGISKNRAVLEAEVKFTWEELLFGML